MQVIICDTREELGRNAAEAGAALIREAITERGASNIILATGASQFEMLKVLVKAPEVDWGRVVGFHLDEYVGLPVTHPASFRKYLRERFVERVPIKEFHYIDGEGDVEAERRRLNEIIERHPIDVAFVGIGENGHLAFNDPPADFETEQPYIIVDLDEKCRKQQVGEGWFKSFGEVPKQAVSMSVKQIMKSRSIICACPDERKAEAVKKCIDGPVSPEAPASILQRHEAATIYLDPESASLLSKNLPR
jgi:glucosamine-6-phosphate deaminase